VKSIIGMMLEKFPVVTHVCEAWTAPDFKFQPSEHPEKQDIVAVAIYSGSSVYMTTCNADERNRRVEKATLFKASAVGGRMAYQHPQSH